MLLVSFNATGDAVAAAVAVPLVEGIVVTALAGDADAVVPMRTAADDVPTVISFDAVVSTLLLKTFELLLWPLCIVTESGNGAQSARVVE